MKLSTMSKATKALVTLPAWQQQALADAGNFTNSIDSVAEAYAKVPLIYRAVKMRCDALSSVPVHLYKGETEVDWPFPCDMRDLIWRMEADLLGAGVATVLKLRNRVRVLDLQRLNPFTVAIHYDNANGLTFSQAGKVWPESDMVYVKEFSYSDDVTSGASTVQACLNDAGLMNYQTRFASRFFENGAMPIILISADGTLVEDETKRIQNFFSKLASGVGNAWRVLATRTKLTPAVVSQDLDKMTMPELYAQATSNIANAFGIPVTMFMGDDNYASADSHRMGFWQDVIRPRAKLIESAFNRQVFKPLGMELEFSFDEMDIFQTDEVERASAFATYVNAGVNPEVVKEMLGIDAPEDMPFMSPKPEPVEVENPIDVTAEFEKWERKALKRLKEGKTADCEFESALIPEVVQDEIHNALKLCIEPDEVKRVFGGGYESPQDIGLYKELKRANDLLERSLADKPVVNVTVNTKDADEPDAKPE